MTIPRETSQRTVSRVMHFPAELSANPEYARIVQRVAQDRLAWILVPGAAVAHWTRHDPEGWSKVQHWLHDQGVTLVKV